MSGKTGAAELYSKRGDCDRVQRALDLLNKGLCLFANELQCNVQRARSHPARMGSQTAYLVRELLNPVSDFFVSIECHEEPHTICREYQKRLIRKRERFWAFAATPTKSQA